MPESAAAVTEPQWLTEPVGVTQPIALTNGVAVRFALRVPVTVGFALRVSEPVGFPESVDVPEPVRIPQSVWFAVGVTQPIGLTISVGLAQSVRLAVAVGIADLAEPVSVAQLHRFAGPDTLAELVTPAQRLAGTERVADATPVRWIAAAALSGRAVAGGGMVRTRHGCPDAVTEPGDPGPGRPDSRRPGSGTHQWPGSRQPRERTWWQPFPDTRTAPCPPRPGSCHPAPAPHRGACPDRSPLAKARADRIDPRYWATS